jgi:hypothetical protein
MSNKGTAVVIYGHKYLARVPCRHHFVSSCTILAMCTRHRAAHNSKGIGCRERSRTAKRRTLWACVLVNMPYLHYLLVLVEVHSYGGIKLATFIGGLSLTYVYIGFTYEK